MKPVGKAAWLRSCWPGWSARPSRVQAMAGGTILLVVCMTGWLAWEGLRPLGYAVDRDLLVQDARPLALPEVTPLPPESLATLQQRVLFKARHQTAVDSGVQATAQDLLKKLTLRSITRQGESLVAYIQVKDEGVKRVAAGDQVAAFSVEKVEPRSVHLKLASEQVVLGF